MKKRELLLSILGIVLTLGLMLTGCDNPAGDNGNGGNIKYTVTFNADGGTVNPTSKEIIAGDTVGTLPTPTKPGYTFGGWFTARNGSGVAFTTTSTVTAAITLYAEWIVIIQNTYYGEFDGISSTAYNLIMAHQYEWDAVKWHNAIMNNPCYPSSKQYQAGMSISELRSFLNGKDIIGSTQETIITNLTRNGAAILIYLAVNDYYYYVYAIRE
ncbi:InlB B-repeat-containing protein [Treponema primitia]|uniref:InlB B-repeat-containing protein n=1 Tax=Treponema primitia TaxID=88058 RepID=UPI0039809E9F